MWNHQTAKLNLFFNFLIPPGCRLILVNLPEQPGGIVVLSAEEEPYHSLAMEVADSELASFVTSWDDALANSPDMIL